MSCQWRMKSHESWEMTQSNPPSELPNDPITSTSSNPDERSSSPLTQSEKSRNVRARSGTQIGDSLFSQAAQQETEPIPRDIGMPNPEDMLIIPDSPSHISLKSDIDEHMSSLRSGQPRVSKQSKPHPKAPRRKEKANAAESDPDDDDFAIPEGGEGDSDSSYVGETPKKKKAPNKSARGKAAIKSRTMTKNNMKTTSTAAKRPKQDTAQKSQPQKKDTITKTAPKRRDPVIKKSNQPKKVIPNSQPVRTENEEKKVQPVVRVPKKSFFAELKDDESTQPTQAMATKSKPELNCGTVIDKNQNSKSQSHVPPNPPTRKDDDSWYQLGSPEKEDSNPLPQIQTEKHVSQGASGTTVGPNSKKKRSSVHSESKQGNTKKNATRTYGHKTVRHLGDSEYFHEREGEETRDQAMRGSSETNYSLNNDMDGIPDSPVNDSVAVKEERNECIKHKRALPIILEEPAPDVTATAQVSMPDMGVNPTESIPLNSPKAEARVVPEKQLRQLVPAPSKANKHTKEGKPQALFEPASPSEPRGIVKNRAVQSEVTGDSLGKVQANGLDDRPNPPVQEALSQIEIIKEDKIMLNAGWNGPKRSPSPSVRTGFNPQRIRQGDGQEGSNKVDAYVDRSQEDPIPTKERQFNLEELGIRRQRHATPVMVDTHSMVSELGSPLTPQKPTVARGATSKHNPLQELQQRINYEKQFKPLGTPQIPVNHDMSWPSHTSQITSDFEPRLVKPDAPLRSTNENPQASKIVKQKILDHLEYHQSMPRVLSPSSSAKGPTKRQEDDVPQAPRLDPKSIDFARRVAQEQKDRDLNPIDDREYQKGDHRPAKQASQLQSKSEKQPRDATRPLLSKTDNLGSFFGEKYPKGYKHNPDNQVLKPEYETKWKDAVDAASEGVVDTLHFITTSLLEHLRTRDESIIAVVKEYKRNGVKISERLAKRQIEEWHLASATAEQKHLELEKFYGDLSRKTQEFRTKCLTKRRCQAYAEWQRQAARVKSAVRAAKEGAIWGEDHD
ncbi:hypothetical protein F4805DRAFT_422671 [Annulohypoxylon moriforme]|nr:hypothetical protein F4805DRAFT_422671 [Annulohypoxylon moriforme]